MTSLFLTPVLLLQRCWLHCSFTLIKTITFNSEEEIHTQLEICCVEDLRKPLYLKLCLLFLAIFAALLKISTDVPELFQQVEGTLFKRYWKEITAVFATELM